MIGRNLNVPVVAVLSLSALCASVHARAEALCPALKAVLDDANNEFKSYRASFDFTFEEYEGSRVFHPLTDCHTYSAGGAATYECALRKLPDDEAVAKSRLDSIHDQVVKCLGADVKVLRKTASSINYTYLTEDKAIQLKYLRMTPSSKRRYIAPSYSLMLSIDAVDLYKK